MTSRCMRIARLTVVAAVLMALATACVASEGVAPSPTQPSPPPAQGSTSFPLSIAPGGRHLIDAQGKPFWIQGDAAWSLIAQLTKSETITYLEDRQSRGFNTILVNLIEHKFATNAPADIAGRQPFTTPGDVATPNDAYFAHAEWVVKQAAERGILVLLAPEYLGYNGGDEGWYQTFEANSPAQRRAYGKYVGNLFKNDPNVIWVMGGDYNPPDPSVVQDVVDGIQSSGDDHLFTAHGSETAAADVWGGTKWLDLNNTYSYDLGLYREDLAQYDRTPVMPYFFIEGAYENEHNATSQQLRAQAYYALTSGATGTVFGNNPIWHFSGPGLWSTNLTWQQALGGEGSVDMAYARSLVEAIPWWTLVPDEQGTFLTSGAGPDGGTHATAAVSGDGHWAVVYVPTQRTLTLDLARLDGTQVDGYWFDPTSGRSRTLPPMKPVSSALASPGANAAGDGDWVLVLNAK